MRRDENYGGRRMVEMKGPGHIRGQSQYGWKDKLKEDMQGRS